MTQFEHEVSHAKDGALNALREAAKDRELQNEYRIASEAFDDADYKEVIALAWRFQFEDDRSKFKREIKALEQEVRKKLIPALQGEQ